MKRPADFPPSYAASVFEKDLESFVALYNAEVHVFDMWAQWEFRGHPSLRKMVSEWFASIGNERVVVTFENTVIEEKTEMACLHSIVKYAAHSSDGKELRSLHNRMSATLCKDGQSWKVIHEHTSAPLDPETLKARLALD